MLVLAVQPLLSKTAQSLPAMSKFLLCFYFTFFERTQVMKTHDVSMLPSGFCLEVPSSFTLQGHPNGFQTLTCPPPHRVLAPPRRLAPDPVPTLPPLGPVLLHSPGDRTAPRGGGCSLPGGPVMTSSPQFSGPETAQVAAGLELLQPPQRPRPARDPEPADGAAMSPHRPSRARATALVTRHRASRALSLPGPVQEGDPAPASVRPLLPWRLKCVWCGGQR